MIDNKICVEVNEMSESLLSIHTLPENGMPDSIRVAIASNNEGKLDGHFGNCLQFLIYQVSPQDIRLIDIRTTAGKEGKGEKNAYLAELIRDCDILYVSSIGGPAAAKVVKHSIHPIKHIEEVSAENVLGKLQEVLSCMPPPWLAKVMGHSDEARVRFETE